MNNMNAVCFCMVILSFIVVVCIKMVNFTAVLCVESVNFLEYIFDCGYR